ncbi:MAG: hypothetical protein M5U26_27335 [Planctomycetota bacterium]|nr:hypothetical protein [Planctomycetota bacterium]
MAVVLGLGAKRMQRFAIYFEAPPEPGTRPVQIVRMSMRALFHHGVKYWPFAASLNDLRDIMKTLQARGQKPDLFVVNTFGSMKLLPSLDFLMGETPVFFFRRTLFWLKDGGGEADAGSTHFSTILKQMTPRLTTVWRYGGANAEDVAIDCARRIALFLADGKFRNLEHSGHTDFDLGNERQAWRKMLGTAD